MFTPTTKQLSLPFLPHNTNSPEVEAAAILATIELQRNKGRGLITKQPPENLISLTEMSYPLWLIPKKNKTLIFDGLNNSSYTLPYVEMLSAKAFIKNLETNAKPRENYTAFLANYGNYFQIPLKEKQFTLKGLIADENFKHEFTIYSKEATEKIDDPLPDPVFLVPTFEEKDIVSILTETEQLLKALNQEADELADCTQLVNKTTQQYKTELDFESAAAKEEADAKIRAQAELVNPQIAKLNKLYSRKIRYLTKNFDQKILSLEKKRTKTKKLVDLSEKKINRYKRETKAQVAEGHVYEKRWRKKINRMERELVGLIKKLENIEESIERQVEQKNKEIFDANFELNTKIAAAKQPLLELEAARDTKINGLKQETQRLLELETAVIDGLNRSIENLKNTNNNFEKLGIPEQEFTSPALIYVPFYVACFKTNVGKRFFIVPPAIFGSINFSSKFKGALGISKIKDLLNPRFQTISALIGNVQELTKQSIQFESQLWMLGEKNNLLKSSLFQKNVDAGLVYLKNEGWLSKKEQKALSSQLTL